MSKKLTPLRAIRGHCLSCAGSCAEVKRCEIKDCLLWTYRFGMSMKRYNNRMTYEHEKRRKKCIKNTMEIIGKETVKNHGK